MAQSTKLYPEYKDNRGWFLRGIKDGVPIGTGYFAVALALGISARNVGISALEGYLMSLGMHASAGEYAAIMLIGAGAGVLEMIITTVVINLRYFLMSCSLTQKLSPDLPFHPRFQLAMCVTDEIFGISSAVPGFLNPMYTYGAMCVAGAGWEGGTVVGILIGSVLPHRMLSALSVALYGMFLAIILPPARKSRFMAGLVVLSMAASAVMEYTPGLKAVSSGFRVIILTVLIAGIAAAVRPVNGRGDKAGEGSGEPGRKEEAA